MVILILASSGRAKRKISIGCLRVSRPNKCTPSNLSFTLACEVIDRKKAGVVRRPFKRFSTLKNCAVRLSLSTNVRLNQLARRRVLDATNNMERTTGFPMMAWPTEIRHQIFECTDLVFQWREGMGSLDGLHVCDGSMPISRPSHCCQRCTSSLAFCRYSYLNGSFSQTCTCFDFPRSLFSISHQIASETRQVVLAENRLILSGNPERTLGFLRHQPSEMLKYNRTVDLPISFEDLTLLHRNGLASWQAGKVRRRQSEHP